MTFVTKLRLQSGDRAVLEDVVEDIQATVERKGAELKGPHSSQPERVKVPQYKRLDGDGRFDSWAYTVYRRDLELRGHDELAHAIATRRFPDSIHVEAEVEQIHPMGSGRD